MPQKPNDKPEADGADNADLQRDRAAPKQGGRQLWRLHVRFWTLFVVVAVLVSWTFQFFFNDTFFMAIESGDQAKVARMLRFNPWLLYARDRWVGMTPLIAACETDQPEMIEFLVQKGASVNTKVGHGFTALILAAAHCRQKEIIELLLARGADVNAPAPGGITPLHVAVWRDHYVSQRNTKEIVQILLSRGAEVNAKDADGKTPLHYAARDDRKEIVALLLANKADPNIKDSNGETAEQVAAAKGHADIVALLHKTATATPRQ